MAPGRLASMLKKAMVISVEDQVEYYNRTVQVGPHVLIITCATFDAQVPRLRSKHRDWLMEHGGHMISACTPPMSSHLVASKMAEGRRVLELGAGMGVCGLIAHKTGATAVVLTDADETAMPRLNENISTNVGFSGETKMDDAKIEAEEGETRPAYARVLRWGDTQAVRELMEELEAGEFDLVMGADLIYPRSMKKQQAMAMIDTTTRDLFVTAAAALCEGGLFAMAHEVRDEMEEVMAIVSKHALGNGFGTPQVVRQEADPYRIILVLPYLGKDGRQEGKTDNTDIASQRWTELVPVLQAAGIGKSEKKARGRA